MGNRIRKPPGTHQTFFAFPLFVLVVEITGLLWQRTITLAFLNLRPEQAHPHWAHKWPGSHFGKTILYCTLSL